ncbi:MAG TPA: bifunctional phosphoglucose/phosphomannose isomerase [Actinomycetota bacterium]|nr:bifunctional phosphoglucose/phosphomannose isomerase [Actinomycetota bacterium]
MTAARLDAPEAYTEADPTDFLATVEGLPGQLAEAIAIASAAGPLPGADGVSSIAVLGMGGSGISGELCRTLLAARARVPVATIRDYALPAWVGPGTLVFAVSYSGDTEETLAGFDTAQARGARIVAITSGGTLAARARAGGHTVVSVPGGLMPRAALGYVGMPALVVADRMGLAPGLAGDLAEAVAVVGQRMAECRRTVPAGGNLAKQLASRLAGVLPLIWGTEGIAGAAAYRWRCQINENAKGFAAWAVFPELNHNEVVGLYGRAEGREPIGVVVLRHDGEPPRTARRIEATTELVGPSVAFIEEVHARGSSEAARLLDLVCVGDLVSTYLGILQGIDPAPIEAIVRLKAALGA